MVLDVAVQSRLAAVVSIAEGSRETGLDETLMGATAFVLFLDVSCAIIIIADETLRVVGIGRQGLFVVSVSQAGRTVETFYVCFSRRCWSKVI